MPGTETSFSETKIHRLLLDCENRLVPFYMHFIGLFMSPRISLNYFFFVINLFNQVENLSKLQKTNLDRQFFLKKLMFMDDWFGYPKIVRNMFSSYL